MNLIIRVRMDDNQHIVSASVVAVPSSTEAIASPLKEKINNHLNLLVVQQEHVLSAKDWLIMYESEKLQGRL